MVLETQSVKEAIKAVNSMVEQLGRCDQLNLSTTKFTPLAHLLSLTRWSKQQH